jgi:hypothetical protein
VFGERADEASRRTFLDFRAGLVRRMQQEWIAELDLTRRERPYLDLVLTHVDDRFDAGMRDSIGADAGGVLPLLETRSFTFLIEDPATVWHLGPERYTAIAERYRALTAHKERLAIDLNIVDRYQNVYPTKQQTGTELFQLVHRAAGSFARVALYFENSLLPPDLKLLPSSAAAVSRIEHLGPKTVIDSAGGVGIPWKGGARVDGQIWPVQDDETLWLPAGPHAVEPAPAAAGPRLVYLNGDLKAARAVNAYTLEFTYQSGSRGMAIVSRAPVKLQVDGVDETLRLAGPATVMLPRGQHVVTLTTD